MRFELHIIFTISTRFSAQAFGHAIEDLNVVVVRTSTHTPTNSAVAIFLTSLSAQNEVNCIAETSTVSQNDSEAHSVTETYVGILRPEPLLVSVC